MSFEKIQNLFKRETKPSQGEKDEEVVDSSRRDFLKKASKAALYAAISASIPKTVEAGLLVGTGKNKPKNSEGLGINISDQIIVRSEKADSQIEAIPEYKRSLERLLLTIPSNESDEYIKNAFFELIAQLPEYTEIELVAKEQNLETIKNIVNELKIENKINYKIFSQDSDHIEAWAQDYGEALKINGQEKFLISGKINNSNSRLDKIDKIRIEKRVEAITDALGKENIEVAKFIFEGGNMTFDEANGYLRVFIGYNDLEFNAFNNGPKKMDLKEVAGIISRNLGGAEVVVMGNHAQEGTFVHIDQSFIILEGKTAIVNQFAKGANPMVRYQHQYYKAQLEKLGYRTIVVENDSDDLELCRSSLNAIPYIDKHSKEKKVIFPVFENEIKKGSINTASKYLKQEDLQGKALNSFAAFKQAGYTPIPARDLVTHAKNGNVHCLSNVLAKMLESRKEMTA